MQVLGSYVGPESDRAKRLGGFERYVQLQSPQIGLLLLRSCLGACKLVCAARSLPFAVLEPTLTLRSCSVIVREDLSTLLGQSLSELQWYQACLSLAIGGLGI